MDVKELFEESVVGGKWDEGTEQWCVLIPKTTFAYLLRLIPRDPNEEDE